MHDGPRRGGVRDGEARGGYVLVFTMLLLVLLAVMAFAWNRRAAMRLRRSAASQAASQRHFDQAGLLEKAAWRLSRNPCWRTGPTGVTEVCRGTAYVVTASDTALPGYTDAVTVSCAPAGAKTRLRAAFRCYLDTAAGTGKSDYSGDGGPAVQAELDKPVGVAADRAGNLYIADKDNHRIRKVSPAGLVSTVAGTGDSGYAGNGGPAVNAELHGPQGVAVDDAGNLYIADTENSWVRRVDAATGVITLYHGAVDVDKPDSGSDAPAMNKPRALFCAGAADVLYIADTENHRILSVTSNGTVRVVAGTGKSGDSGDGGLAVAAELDKPRGVFFSPAGDLYIADTDNHRVRKVDASGIITTVAGTGSGGYEGDGGPATAAKIDKPRGLAVDAAGNVLFVDEGKSSLRVVRHTDGVILAIAGNGSNGYDGDGLPAAGSRLRAPCGLALADVRGSRIVFIGDRDNHRVRALRWRLETSLY